MTGRARRVGLLMEHQKKRIILQKTCRLGCKSHQRLCGDGFWYTGWGSCSFTFKTKQSPLSVKVPAQSAFSHADAQTHRLLVRQARPHLSHYQENEFNMRYKTKSEDAKCPKKVRETFSMERRLAKPFGCNDFSDW